MEPFNNAIDDNEIDDSYIDTEVFLLIGNSLLIDFQKTKSEEDLFTLKEFLKKEKEEKEAKEKEENKIAIQILQQKIKEYEEQKNKGFFSKLFTTKKDLFYENLETERYYYNKTLLDQLLRKVEQNIQ